MSREQFIDAFYEIDRDFKHEITADELQEYVERNNCNPQMAEKWLTLFDPDNTGVITLDMFCQQMGIKADVMKRDLAERRASAANVLPPQFSVISKDMKEEDVREVCRIVDDGIEQDLIGVNLCRHIKQTLDSKYGRVWHTLMVRNQYWAFYSHEAGFSVIVKVGRDIFIIFRTPNAAVNTDEEPTEDDA